MGQGPGRRGDRRRGWVALLGARLGWRDGSRQRGPGRRGLAPRPGLQRGLPLGLAPRPGRAALVGLLVVAALAGGMWTGTRSRAGRPEPPPEAGASPESVARALEGKVIVLDPGHGGPDGGVVGVAGTPEKEITLAVALRLRDLLLLAGARPVLTRETDTDLRDQAVPTETTRRRQELMARVRLAEIHQADVLLSIHANALGRNSRWQGAQVFYDPRGRPEGERLAQALQGALRELTGTTRTHRPIKQLVLERSPVPAANVEVGFLSNAEEERRLRDPEYQDRLAHAILLGLARYFAASPPPPGPSPP
ncbi:MAG: N-acetylmuramoyl-L-alanine amidase, partial [Bacillota bacterium]